jgi:hypothetical protein
LSTCRRNIGLPLSGVAPLSAGCRAPTPDDPAP